MEPLLEQLLYEYRSWCNREEIITDFEYISSILLSNEFVNQFLIACLFLSFIGAVVLVFGTIYRKINERLTYIFLSIYFSSLAILLIYVLFLFLMDCNINITETFHTVSIVCKESVSWCSAHAYIIRYIMELELIAQFTIVSLITRVTLIGIFTLVGILLKILMRIRKSSYHLGRIFHIAVFGVKVKKS